MNKSFLCPVCGYNLGFKPWEGDSSSDEICPSCGIQFGYHDVPEASGIRGSREKIYFKWRNKWIKNGMIWSSSGMKSPKNWNPHDQLKRIGINTNHR